MIKKRHVIFLVKISISMILLYFVFQKIDFKNFLQIIETLNVWLFLLSLLLFNFSLIISVFRLNIFLESKNIFLSYIYNILLYYVGIFYSFFLPGGISGDAYKIYVIKKKVDIKVISLINVMFSDRMNGLVTLIGFIVLFIFFSSFKNIFYSVEYIFLALFCITYILYMILSNKLQKLSYSTIQKATMISILIHISEMVLAYVIIVAINGVIEIADLLILFIISSIVTALPISIAGVGARELVFLYGYEFLHLDVNEGIAFSLIYFIITAFSALIGVFFLKNISEVKLRIVKNDI